jgi:hypothetical protein
VNEVTNEIIFVGFVLNHYIALKNVHLSLHWKGKTWKPANLGEANMFIEIIRALEVTPKLDGKKWQTIKKQ